MIRFMVVLLMILVFALFDLPFLLRTKNKLPVLAYSLLLLIGIGICYILMEDLPMASPAVYIEKTLNLIVKR